MKPGARWVYRETDAQGSVQRVVVTVTNETKRIANGVEARVVHDVVTEGGEPVEVTDDWYAQDAEGNIWYLGEKTAEYEDGTDHEPRRLLRGRRRRRAGRRCRCPASPRSGWPIARSTTPARPRTRGPC